jgi:hypothetical protein
VHVLGAGPDISIASSSRHMICTTHGAKKLSNILTHFLLMQQWPRSTERHGQCKHDNGGANTHPANHPVFDELLCSIVIFG